MSGIGAIISAYLALLKTMSSASTIDLYFPERQELTSAYLANVKNVPSLPEFNKQIAHIDFPQLHDSSPSNKSMPPEGRGPVNIFSGSDRNSILIHFELDALQHTYSK